MILNFDNSILDNVNNADLARVVGLIYDRGHKIEKNPVFRRYIVENIISKSYFGQLKIDKIRNSIGTRSITDFERSCYSTINVGNGADMVGLSDLLIILSCSNFLVLENALYDFEVIKRWVEFLKNDKIFSDVNSSVKDAIDNGYLLPYNAGGGNGTISNAMKVLIPACGGAPRYKLTAIFDSDKLSSTDTLDHNKSVKNFLSSYGISFHELNNREIENYFSVDTFDDAGFVLNNSALLSMSDVDLDYVDMEHSFTGYEKKQIPRLCKYMQKSRLLKRIKHHLVCHPEFGDLTEIQIVILLLAKLI